MKGNKTVANITAKLMKKIAEWNVNAATAAGYHQPKAPEKLLKK